MPIYEYECSACHAVFEEWVKQAADADEAVMCPSCGVPARRIISQTSFALKGEGWYVTEYGSKKGIKDSGQDSASASASSASSTPASTPAPAAAGG